jgi:ABC-2 type transport system permease protein
MNHTLHAARLGVDRGLIEFRHTLQHPQELGFNIFITVVCLVVLVFQRDSMVEEAGVSLAMLTLPSIVGLMIAFGGLMGAAMGLAVEREDGTLLRAKAIPNGMVGYLIAGILGSALYTMLGLAMILVPGLFLIDGLTAAGVSGWLTFAWVLVLGLLAVLPWGVIIGSLARSPGAGFNLVMGPISAITAISGIFYPISALPEWAQAVAQVFPIYWLGLGMRSALLPDAAAAAEIGESWRHLEMVGVLSVWAVVGLLIAPSVLRRMARKESGATVEARRQKALQRVS